APASRAALDAAECARGVAPRSGAAAPGVSGGASELADAADAEAARDAWDAWAGGSGRKGGGL
ncbi:MAG: hypothetical protein LBQ12_11150, partial [Deltaproteobacteria bacterium]|nr:hypothetical protein [Deltaproteobacteria bacterium]